MDQFDKKVGVIKLDLSNNGLGPSFLFCGIVRKKYHMIDLKQIYIAKIAQEEESQKYFFIKMQKIHIFPRIKILRIIFI